MLRNAPLPQIYWLTIWISVEGMEHFEGVAYRHEEDMLCVENDECSKINSRLFCNGFFCQCKEGTEWIWRSKFGECKKTYCAPLNHDCEVHDSSDCSGGWTLGLKNGQSMAFDGNIFSESWWRKNDIDRVGVRPGCLLTMWTEDNFQGLQLSYGSNSRNRWVVLSEDPHYKIMHENIESMKCDCSPDLHLPPRIGASTTEKAPMVAMKRVETKKKKGLLTTTPRTTEDLIKILIARDRRHKLRAMSKSSYDWEVGDGGDEATTQTPKVNRRLCLGQWDSFTKRCMGVMQCPSYCRFWQGTGECWLRTGWLGNPIRCGGE